MKKLDAAKLNEMYEKSDSCDKDLFAEMRSNVRLISGNHYSRTASKLFHRMRDV
jgi:hypothetical protein